MTKNEVLEQFVDMVDSREAMESKIERMEKYGYEFLIVRVESDDWQELPEYSCSVGKSSINYSKNRYRDVLPYDSTRVLLSNVGRSGSTDDATDSSDQTDSSYINASFIKGHDNTVQYITTQAPLDSTISDFWCMIRQCSVVDIVMLCGLVEQGKKKCSRYWPEKCGDTVSVGNDCSVQLESEQFIDSSKHLIVRSLLLKCMTDSSSQKVRQYQYTEWPDYGKPDDYMAVIQMLENVHKHRKQGDTPIVVHCSAGCGRSGAIIAIDIVWNHLKSSTIPDKLNINDIVLELRRQRPAMVQSLDQFILVHLVCAELFRQHLGRSSKQVTSSDQRTTPTVNGTDSEPDRPPRKAKESPTSTGAQLKEAVKGYLGLGRF